MTITTYYKYKGTEEYKNKNGVNITLHCFENEDGEVEKQKLADFVGNVGEYYKIKYKKGVSYKTGEGKNYCFISSAEPIEKEQRD